MTLLVKRLLPRPELLLMLCVTQTNIWMTPEILMMWTLLLCWSSDQRRW